MHYKSILYCFLGFFFLNFSFDGFIKIHTQPTHPDFYLITIPKSGSHLMHKLMKMLLNIQPKDPQIPYHNNFTFPNDLPKVPQPIFTQALLSINKEKFYPSSHTNLSGLYFDFNQTHPNYTRIVLIRDLRDILVSCVHFQWNEIEEEIGPSSFDQKLSFLINLGQTLTKNKILNIYRFAEAALPWLNDPKTVLIRFEDLIGTQGGGNAELQAKAITIIANALQIPLDEEHLEIIIQELFGKERGPQMPTTFREGKIESWKNHFNLENFQDFNQKWNHLQTAFGYK